MNDELGASIQQLSDLVRQHIPTEALPPLLPTAIVTLLFGVCICVLGAKLARWFITVMFVVGGMTAGLELARRAGFSPGPSALTGGVLLGAIGYVLHRLWVGVLAGVVLASVALTAYSSETMLPKLIEFDQKQLWLPQPQAGTTGDFVIPSADQPRPTGWDHAQEYFSKFHEHLASQQPQYFRNATLYTLGAGLIGFVLGLLLWRFTLIIFSAVVGTWFIATGLAMAASALSMDVRQICQDSPGISLAAVAAFLVTSIALQAALTRPNPRPAPARAPARAPAKS